MISMSYLQPFENVLHSGKLPTPTSTAASTAVSHSKEIKGNSNSPDSLIKLLHFCELLNQEQIPFLSYFVKSCLWQILGLLEIRRMWHIKFCYLWGQNKNGPSCRDAPVPSWLDRRRRNWGFLQCLILGQHSQFLGPFCRTESHAGLLLSTSVQEHVQTDLRRNTFC